MKRGAKKDPPFQVPGVEIGRWQAGNIRDSELVLLAKATTAMGKVPAVQVEGAQVALYALEPAVFEQVKQHATRRAKPSTTKESPE